MKSPYPRAALDAAINAVVEEAQREPPEGEDLDGFTARIKATMQKALDEYEPFK